MSGTLGQKLKKYRLAKGLTMEQLAQKLGIDQSYISLLESGKRGKRPDLPMLREFAKALGVTPNDLIVGSVLEKSKKKTKESKLAGVAA